MKSKTPEYQVWSGIKQRCLNPNCTAFKNYGERGVTVCDRWANSFDNFISDMGNRPSGTSIDRIDVNGNYEPGNCRWATPTEQSRNQRVHLRDDVGVSFDKRDSCWNAFITVDGRSIRVGGFKSKVEAIDARKKAELQYWKDGLQAPTPGSLAKHNTSGVKGVYFNKTHQMWDAYIYIGRKKKDLGRFKTFEEAKATRISFDNAIGAETK